MNFQKINVWVEYTGLTHGGKIAKKKQDRDKKAFFHTQIRSTCSSPSA